jgi:quinol-cytochrome oxidoreductase complex cytochrome b subunit
MDKNEGVEDQIFPRDPRKSYGLVAMMDRSSPQVDKGPEDTLFSFPVVLLWEIVLMLGVTLAIFLFSLIKQAPLEEIANPQVTTDPAKAPWYFVGLQELLEHMHPTLAGVIIPGLLVGFLILLPYLDPSRVGVGRWFGSRRGRRITVLTTLYALLVMSAYILLDNAFTLRELLRDVTPQWVAQGLLPAAILALLVVLPVVVLTRFQPSRSEVIMVLFTMLMVSAFVYTLSGFLFRGPGFKLFLPWSMPDGYNPWDGL